MKKLRALIIDDEPDAIDVLQILLEDYRNEIEVKGTSTTAIEGLKMIQKEKPDVVFLDIEMTGMSGLELIDLVEKKEFYLVFVTAYENYALQALKAKADDYLLKPVDLIEFEKMMVSLRKERANLSDFQINEDKIAIPIDDSVSFVELSTIDYLEACDNYTYVHFIDKRKKLVTKRLRHFEDALKDKGFLRVHRSFVINIHRLKGYFKRDGGYLLTYSGATIYLPRRNKEEILNKIKDKIIEV